MNLMNRNNTIEIIRHIDTCISNRLFGYIIIFFFILIVTPLFSKTVSIIDYKSFAAKDYVNVISGIATVLTDVPEQPQKEFVTITAVAIALSKTHGWTGDSGKKAVEMLKSSPDALRYLDAIHLLLEENIDGLNKLFDGKPPDEKAMVASVRLLREHGYELGANCLGVAQSDINALRIISWLHIPPDKNIIVVRLMTDRLSDKQRADLARTAMQMSLQRAAKPKMVDVSPRALFDFALFLGRMDESIISFATAERLAARRQIDEASLVINAIVANHPNDVRTSCRASAFLWAHARYSEAATLYKLTIDATPEPDARAVRLDYLSFLHWSQQDKHDVPGVDNLAEISGLVYADMWME